MMSFCLDVLEQRVHLTLFDVNRFFFKLLWKSFISWHICILYKLYNCKPTVSYICTVQSKNIYFCTISCNADIYVLNSWHSKVHEVNLATCLQKHVKVAAHAEL